MQTTVAGAAINLALTDNASISTTSGTSSAILVNQVAGAITITAFSGNTIPGSHAGTGVSITNARFDQTPGGAYQTVSAGAATIGASGNGVGAAGMVFTNVAGDLVLHRSRHRRRQRRGAVDRRHQRGRRGRQHGQPGPARAWSSVEPRRSPRPADRW